MAQRTDTPSKAAVTVPEAARLLGVGIVLVNRALQRGELPCIRIGGRVLIPKPAFEEFLKGKLETSADQ